ncbi:hypothetical protein Sjap_007444 [Stephania japonica]|uniref:FLZ-type domain-containing protein n=1 Tax=Stephania japonica TaxID=461633 RepID=A0AAP0JNI5_9MAGN
MVGLSIVLEGQNKTNNNNYYVKKSSTTIKNPKATPPPLLQVINKTNINTNTNTNTIPSSSSSSSSSYNYYHYSSSPLSSINFLDNCYLCQKPLLPNKDIFMYRGDRAFCSEECRCRHICMDDEESLRREKCSMVAKMMKISTSSSSASTSRASHRKANTTTNKNTKAGGFAY